jgi:SecD/SecF fusion protein
MTDRRRNLAILLLVGVLLAGAVAAIFAQSTKLGLDLKGGVELVYEARPAAKEKVTSDAINRAIEIMRKRVDSLGVAEPEIQQSGEQQITVALPDVSNAKEAADQVGTTAQMFFFDWEKSVIGPDGKTAPLDTAVTGGGSAGRVSGACKPQYEAIALAAKQPARSNENQAIPRSKFYFVNDKAKSVVAGPEASRPEITRATRTLAFERKGGKGRVAEVKPGTIIVRAEVDDSAPKAQQNPDCYFVLQDSFSLRGTDIKNPEQNFDQRTQAPNVTFEFTDKGRKKWKDTTKEIAQRGQESVGLLPADAANQHFAIVLDNELISVPYIDFSDNPDGIDGGQGSEISGGFTIKSAQKLANELKYGALPVELKLVSQSQVSATLGQEALDQGILAATIGFALTVLFLLVFYRLLGILAVAALVLYGIYLFALIRSIPVVLTLPGMAGLVLTIGVCADANIVVFERIKEEIGLGRSVRTAISQGYKRGLSTIIDANVVTFMTAFILFMLSTAGVKGFALMLGLGTLVTLFSAILATQALLGATGGAGLTSAGSVGARTHGRKRQLNFAGATKWLFSLSGVILAAGSLAIATKGFELGIDFKSGTRIQMGFQRPADEDKIRDVLAKQGLESAEVQRVTGSNQGPNTFQISTGQLQPPQVARVTDALNQAFGIRGSPDSESIGPTFGKSIARSALIAVIASLLVIAAYIALRFEWKYAGTTAISLMHDLFITGGLYAITGREVNSSTVAALLTVLGFSLYDTIIVSDRIRENTPRMPTATFSQINNRSMNEVIVRSLATVTCASLPILALFVFGGQTLQDFAFALLVGTISGAYSSIFISSPVLTEWKEREPAYRRRRAAQMERFGGVVPPFAPEGSVVEVKDRAAKPAKRLTAPEDPSRAVSKAEFDAMVRELETDAKPAVEEDPARDLSPEDLVMKDDKKPRPKRGGPRNKRHGRPR